MNNQTSNSDTKTHFGFRDVDEAEKTGLVGEVFHSVADRYDLMNDLMSLGIHRLWKRFAVLRCGLRAGDRVLDVAAGSGDLSYQFSRLVGPDGSVTASDINSSMLARGRERLIDKGVVGNINYVLADAEALPFVENYFDCITIGFGLRNVTRQQAALNSMFRCLRPGGKVLILEFSKPGSPLLSKVYDLYSFQVLPKLGQVIAKDADSYRYLAESIRKHPPQQELKAMMETAGFERVDFNNLSGGIVAVHTGYKF